MNRYQNAMVMMQTFGAIGQLSLAYIAMTALAAVTLTAMAVASVILVPVAMATRSKARKSA
jgi:hypothetical protein